MMYRKNTSIDLRQILDGTSHLAARFFDTLRFGRPDSQSRSKPTYLPFKWQRSAGEGEGTLGAIGALQMVPRMGRRSLRLFPPLLREGVAAE
jgi:hypothetical protein